MWYKCWESEGAYYAAFYNFGSKTKEGSVPVEGGTFALQLMGPGGDCGMEKGVLRAEVPPRTLMIFSIMQSPLPGLYRENVLLPGVSEGKAVYYAAADATCAVYTLSNGKPELIDLLYNGDETYLSPNAFIKQFLWDAAMRPIA